MTNRSNITNPKLNMRPIFCDVCGSQCPIKDVRKVTDKHNRRFGLILCKPCFAVNKTNPQDRPFTVKETILYNTDLVRPEPNPTYTVNENDDRVPGKPSEGSAIIDPLTNTINLYWQPPQDQGSSLVIGYIVKRAEPQLGVYDTLTSDTETGTCYYVDTTGSLTAEYSYTVTAINSFGSGSESEPFFWPTNLTIWADIEYIVDGAGNIIMGGDGYLLRSNHTDAGAV